MTRVSTTSGRAALVIWIAAGSAATLNPSTPRLVLEAASAVAAIGHGALAIDQSLRLALAITVAFVPLPPLLVVSFPRLHPVLASAVGAAASGAAAALAANDRRDLVAVTTAALVGIAVGTLIAAAVRVHADDQRTPRWVRATAMAALGAFLIATCFIGFWHAPVDQGVRPALDSALTHLRSDGAPVWLGYDAIEFAANIVFFAPLGFLLALMLPPHRRWLAVAIGFVLSSCIEIGQGLLLPARSASLDDLAANTAGTALGALAGVVVSGWVAHRAERGRARH